MARQKARRTRTIVVRGKDGNVHLQVHTGSEDSALDVKDALVANVKAEDEDWWIIEGRAAPSWHVEVAGL